MPLNTATQILSHVDRGSVDHAILEARRALTDASLEQRGPLLISLSTACVSAGQHLEALRAAAAANAAFKEAGDLGGMCDALVKVGIALRAAGDHASAISSFEEAESLAREIEDEVRRAAVVRQIGVCCSLVGRHQQALSYLSEAHDLYERTGPESELLGARLSLYNAHNRHAMSLPEGNAERASTLAAMLDVWPVLADAAATSGNLRLAIMARGNYGITLHQYGHHREAVIELDALLPRYRAHGMRPNEAICLSELGGCHAALGEPALARDHFRDAVALLDAEGSADDQIAAYEGLSAAEAALGQFEAALAALRRVRDIEKRKSDEAARGSAAQRELRIELARLTNQWAALATQDPLTNLGNRRALERWMTEHLPHAELGEPLTLLLMDLDHFKTINDRYGHAVGDEVLRRVATVIAANCRGRDLAVRYGGEEFVLALNSVDHVGAIGVADRLREAVAGQPWSVVSDGLAVSISIGAAHASEAADAQSLLTLADRRLYAAKYAGRNQVVSHG